MVVLPVLRGVEEVIIMGQGGGGGFVVRLNVGDEVVDGRIEMLSREVEVRWLNSLKLCTGKKGRGWRLEVLSLPDGGRIFVFVRPSVLINFRMTKS